MTRRTIDVPAELDDAAALDILDQIPVGGTVAAAARERYAEVRSMNDQLGNAQAAGKYAVVKPEDQVFTIIHETAALCRVISGNQWEAIARAENGKYWRIVEQEKA